MTHPPWTHVSSGCWTPTLPELRTSQDSPCAPQPALTGKPSNLQPIKGNHVKNQTASWLVLSHISYYIMFPVNGRVREFSESSAFATSKGKLVSRCCFRWMPTPGQYLATRLFNDQQLFEMAHFCYFCRWILRLFEKELHAKYIYLYINMWTFAWNVESSASWLPPILPLSLCGHLLEQISWEVKPQVNTSASCGGTTCAGCWQTNAAVVWEMYQEYPRIPFCL